MKKNGYKKIFVIGAALFLLFAPIGLTWNGAGLVQNPSAGGQLLSLNVNTALAQTPSPAPVQKPSFYSCLTSGNLATCSVFYVAYMTDTVMSLLVALGAFLVRLGLQFNANVFNSPAVQTGFSVSLAIANLGFVLGIIVIALATIIRNQTYGIKQLLWKLVVMAILVNFGLVIAAPIVGFADSMSNYFINATSPGAATGGYEGYATTMAEAFAPQQTTDLTGSGCTGATGGLGALCNTENGLETTATAPDAIVQQTLSMVFGVVFLALTAFTFMCLAILLIIRYLMLGGLLIVLPLAWLTWVFPKFDNSYSKWWDAFVKWTFFPPLALFFIYLAFTTAANTGGAAAQNAYLQQAAQLPAGAATGPEGALAYQTGAAGPIQQAADEILLVGLTVMGLLFANSLSGKAGKVTVGAAKGGTKAFGTWVGKNGRRAGYSAASRVLQPKTRIDPATGAVYTPLTQMNRFRGAAAQWTAGRAASPNLKTKGLAGTVWGGVKGGSGLFKEKGSNVKDWECSVCQAVIRATKKPTGACPNGHPAATAQWHEA